MSAHASQIGIETTLLHIQSQLCNYTTSRRLGGGDAYPALATSAETSLLHISRRELMTNILPLNYI